MPESLDRCVAHVKGQGHDESSAYAICRAAMGMKEDGSEDEKAPEMPEHELLIRAASEITKRQFENFPRLRKWMPLCEAIGHYVNGPDKGELTVALFKEIVANQKKMPRQIPVYLIVGDLNPEHPEDLDARLADGWIEDLKVEGKWLWGDVTLNGNAAVAVITDGVRGASIGAGERDGYDGKPLGMILEHAVLTNNPYVKGMNVAARSKGSSAVAHYFTALKQEGDMPEPKKEPEGNVSDQPPSERIEALEVLLQEQKGQIKALTDERDAALEELKQRRESKDTELLLTEKRHMEIQMKAMRIRELVSVGLNETHQFNKAQTSGYEGGPGRSDAVTLAWFKTSVFEGDMEKLRYALKTWPKTILRQSFNSGVPTDKAEGYTSEEEDTARKAGKDPALLQRTGRATNYTEWKQIHSEAKGA